MKKIVIWTVIVVGFVAMVWIGSERSNSPIANNQTIKIGAILPLTGSNALHGEFAKRGIEMALKELKGQNIENLKVIYEDSQYDPKLAVGAFNKLVETDKTKAILFLGSPVGMALAPLANNDRISLLGIVSAPAYSTPNDYTFRIVGSAIVEAETLAKTVVDTMKAKTVAVFYMNNDYGKGVDAGFKAAIGDKVSIIAEESFLPQETNFRTQLTKIKSLNPDLVLIPALAKETGLVLKQARELGMKNIFMCSSACESPDLIVAAGTAANGLILVAPTDQANKEFADAYKKRYGDSPNFVSMRMYDATKILSVAFNQCASNPDPNCLAQMISGIKDFPGSSYAITFNANGDINDQFIVKTVKNGQFVKLAP